MSESSAKSSQPLASKGEKDVSEKRGRGRPRKKPQVRGDPWEERGWGGHPTGQLCPQRCPQGLGTPRLRGSKKPPPLTPQQHPLGRDGDAYGAAPRYLPLGSTAGVPTSRKNPPGGFTAPPPPTLQHPRAPSHPGKGSGPPFAPPRAAAESAFADGLIKAPLAKAAQRDKMLPEPL